MYIIFNFVKVAIISMIALHLLYIYLIITIQTNNCSNHILNVYWIVLTKMIALLLLFIRMFYGISSRNYHQINWNDNVVESIQHNQYNIMSTFKIVQYIFAGIGLLSIKSIWNYVLDKDCPINEFIGFGFIPYVLISLNMYYNICYVVVCVFATIFIPKRMFQYFDELLDQRYIHVKKFYPGNSPECCVCYDENCWINECGHLICKECIDRMQSYKCPLCKSNISLIQSFQNYKKNNPSGIHAHAMK